MVVSTSSVVPQLSTGRLMLFGWQPELHSGPAPASANTAAMTTSCILSLVKRTLLPQEGIRYHELMLIKMRLSHYTRLYYGY